MEANKLSVAFEEVILEENKKTNRLLEKLIGLLQAAAEPDTSYHDEIIKSGVVKIPK